MEIPKTPERRLTSTHLSAIVDELGRDDTTDPYFQYAPVEGVFAHNQQLGAKRNSEQFLRALFRFWKKSRDSDRELPSLEFVADLKIHFKDNFNLDLYVQNLREVVGKVKEVEDDTFKLYLKKFLKILFNIAYTHHRVGFQHINDIGLLESQLEI